ncbi:uncharacterized protein LOC119117121 isoform X6 [Syngnathus acus]|uniref:uncharacterized protein LOC119117121 isoform X6 n=1 Tax=Syngnathus acus TaxID=161584 RepID=UPI001885E990|nr:uncharacterized protein LOC119117121 isoform X6 [Syngnathus acus]
MERARFLGLCGLGYSLLRAQVGSTFVVKSLAGSRFVFSQNEQRPQNGVRSAFLSSFGETFPVRVDCSLKPISLSAAADGGGCERRRPPAESRGGGQGPETHQIGNEQSVMGISFSKSTATGGFSGCKLGWRRSPWQQRKEKERRLPACLRCCLRCCLPACVAACVAACLPACLPAWQPQRVAASLSAACYVCAG